MKSLAAGYDGSIRIDTGIDTKGFNAGTKQISSGLNGIGKSMATAFSVAAIVELGGQVIETTAKLQAMDAQFDQIFKGTENEKAVAAINTQADKLGINADRLTSSYSKFGGQVKGAGIEATQALQATEKATGLAADAAAFYDQSLETSSAMLASFMKGNFEAGDAIGVFTNASQMSVKANEMYGKSWADLSEAERQWLLLDAVDKTYQMNGAAGQAAREQGNWANVTANLSAIWSRFLEYIGSPVLSGAITVIQGLSGGITGLFNFLKEHETLATVIGIGIGGLATALLAYTVAQNAAAIATTISTAATTAFGAVIAFLTSPITLIVLAIAALIAIIVLLVKHWDDVKATASRVWTEITKIWGIASNWFSQKVLDPIKSGFKGAINFLIGLAEGFVNGFIRGINAIINALNGIKFTAPDWVPVIGGKNFGLNIRSVRETGIPRLATGAVIPPNGEFLAVLGDQRSGRNLEAPEDLIRQIVREEAGGQEMISVLKDIHSAIREGKVIAVDSQVLGKVVNKSQSTSFKTSGKTLIPV